MINHHVPRMEAMERDWEEGIDALFMMSHLLRIELRIEITSTVLASALLFYSMANGTKVILLIGSGRL